MNIFSEVEKVAKCLMGSKVSTSFFLEFRSFVLNNIFKINSTAWCWWNRLGTRGILYIALFNLKILKRYLRVLVSSAIYCEFEPRLGQTKEYKIGICWKKRKSSPSHWKLTCSRHDMAEKCSCGIKQQSLTHSMSKFQSMKEKYNKPLSSIWLYSS
jgi:hypothetical protein